MAYPPWLHWLDECPSTNTWALQSLARLQPGDVIYTPRQTAGRGREGRAWYAPPGVLTASFVLHPVAAAHLPQLSLAAGLAVIHAVEDTVPLSPGTLGIKWPNDVVLNGRKLAGVLCEPSLPWVVVGVGLNRAVDWHTVLATATPNLSLAQVASLLDVTPHPPDVLTVLSTLRRYLLEAHSLLQQGGWAKLLPQLRQRDVLNGCPLVIHMGQQTMAGVGAGLDDQGRLLLQGADGTIHALTAGHVVRWEPSRFVGD
ncbi:MAG: biotin--[acetyl-CoA-carboxylase] ligase [Gloeomargarita sp. SKYG116]|nr:biotin--[acetyl-CoA-carboxylase] ligase [Gloeomargarita sp. SKYG116]MDW8400645.1 biotin--[acetyl-CoA-carboxylase] ligase [Gloeomargarita sp. SKYGB_i_bin116]